MSVGERVNTWGLKETNLVIVIVIVMGMVIVTIMITSYRGEHKGKLLEEERWKGKIDKAEPDPSNIWLWSLVSYLYFDLEHILCTKNT